MRVRTYVCLVLLTRAIDVVCATEPTALTVNDSGDAGNGSCTTVCTLRDAIANIAADGTIDFDPAILPATISLEKGELALGKAMRIEGPGAGQLAISAAMSSRVVSTEASVQSASVTISGLTLRDGAVVGGNGGGGAAATGQTGGPGDSASGGCVLVASGKLTLERVSIRNCLAQGGGGGSGGTGTTGTGLSTGGIGGPGGMGGNAIGGAIVVNHDAGSAAVSELVLISTSIIDAQALGGNGGPGGDGGIGFFRGKGGLGGDGGIARGGAIYYVGTSGQISNSTVARGSAYGGTGGKGGSGDPGLATANGGKGGNGGGGTAGLAYLVYAAWTLDPLRVDFTTLADGLAVGGGAGGGGAGATPGAVGQFGAIGAFALVSAGAAAALNSSAIVGFSFGANTLCKGSFYVYLGAVNADSDGSCGTLQTPSVQAPFETTFRSLSENAGLPFYMPMPASAVIDAAASCNDSYALALTQDGQATPRPQGAACDIGAIESDYVFVDGFD